jgi:hypothetical protein
MSGFREWRAFWGEVVNMWRKKHGITLANCLKASFPIAVLSFIGLLVSIFQGSHVWQALSGLLLGSSVLTLFFTLCFVLPFEKWSNDTKKRDARIDELTPLEEYKSQQIGHEQDWLQLVVEYVDLEKRQGLSENQVSVKFQFDSGLVYAFQPDRMWVSPILGGYEANERQHEIISPPNFLPGKRSRLSTTTLTIKDEGLMDLIRKARTDNGKSMKTGLKVEMQLRSGQSPVVFRPDSY